MKMTVKILHYADGVLQRELIKIKVFLEFEIRYSLVQKSSPYLQQQKKVIADLRDNNFLSASYLNKVGVWQ